MSDPIREEAKELLANWEMRKKQLGPKYNPAQEPCEKLCEARRELSHQRFINQLQAQNLHEEIERRQKLQDEITRAKEKYRCLAFAFTLLALAQTAALVTVLALTTLK